MVVFDVFIKGLLRQRCFAYNLDNNGQNPDQFKCLFVSIDIRAVAYDSLKFARKFLNELEHAILNIGQHLFAFLVLFIVFYPFVKVFGEKVFHEVLVLGVRTNVRLVHLLELSWLSFENVNHVVEHFEETFLVFRVILIVFCA
jgi:hypothetical protein